MNDPIGPWKLLLCLLQHVRVLTFQTEEGAEKAQEFYSHLGWHAEVVYDGPPAEEEETA